MPKSSISKLRSRGAGSGFARALGQAIRDRRRARGLTQTQLGNPLTKGYVSEVERGRSLPSLRALAFLAERLDIPLAELLGQVKEGLPAVYTPRDENQHTAAAPRHR